MMCTFRHNALAGVAPKGELKILNAAVDLPRGWSALGVRSRRVSQTLLQIDPARCERKKNMYSSSKEGELSFYEPFDLSQRNGRVFDIC